MKPQTADNKAADDKKTVGSKPKDENKRGNLIKSSGK